MGKQWIGYGHGSSIPARGLVVFVHAVLFTAVHCQCARRSFLFSDEPRLSSPRILEPFGWRLQPRLAAIGTVIALGLPAVVPMRSRNRFQ
ncbi:hypothetical protein [Pseudomonas sp. CFBP 13719]|uniref:hypothetical protein n=1 Tax=Pseudomonas sp. CFBP 13719 TaxID=2775303 RepID=UPI00177C25BD|nr:hypothetical protein [Pseudomonas sp. CFBP 13719]MBD8683832.1 hypothetical protein [Pseudomonas sp. CFBP 13719]